MESILLQKRINEKSGLATRFSERRSHYRRNLGDKFDANRACRERVLDTASGLNILSAGDSTAPASSTSTRTVAVSRCFVGTESASTHSLRFDHEPRRLNRRKILTPLEAMRTFPPQIDTPTAELRPDHFDRQSGARARPLTIEAIAPETSKESEIGWNASLERSCRRQLTHFNALHARPSPARHNATSGPPKPLQRRWHRMTYSTSSMKKDRLVIKSSGPTTSNSSALIGYGVTR